MKKIKNLNLILFAFVFFFLKESLALNALKEKTSLKALGMGNAYSALVEDDDAFFYNPAQIAEFKRIRWNILSGNLGISSSFFSNFNQIRNLESEEKFADVINSFYSDSFGSQVGARASIEMPYFMFMVSLDGDFNLIPMDPPFPIIHLDMYSDVTYGIGFGFPVLPYFNLGATLKKVKRDGITEQIGPEWLVTLDPELIQNEVRKTGSAYIFDLGSSFKLETYPKPTFSVVWKNPFNTKFKSQKEGTPPPTGYESELMAGMGLTLNLGLFKLKPALDLKHLLKTHLQWTKKVHFGVELEAPLITVRTGFNQGYWTAGTTLYLLFGLIQLNGAYYSQELGEYAGQFHEERFALNMKVSVATGELALNQMKKGSKSFFRGVKKIWRKLKKRRY